MQLLTVARRAGLGDRIQRRRQSLLNQLSTSRSYLNAVGAQVRLSGLELIFHRSTFITGLVGIAEAYITDSTVEFLVCFPSHLSSKTFDLKALVTARSALHIIRGIAERVVNELAYQSFPDMVSDCLNFFATGSVIDRSLLEAVNEVKCARDLFVHNSGRVNSTYRRKVGNLARGDVGEILDVSQNTSTMLLPASTAS